MTDEPSNAKEHLNMLRIIANLRQSDKLFHLLASVGEFERPRKRNGDKKKNSKWQMMQCQIGTRHTHFFFLTSFRYSDGCSCAIYCGSSIFGNVSPFLFLFRSCGVYWGNGVGGHRDGHGWRSVTIRYSLRKSCSTKPHPTIG